VYVILFMFAYVTPMLAEWLGFCIQASSFDEILLLGILRVLLYDSRFHYQVSLKVSFSLVGRWLGLWVRKLYCLKQLSWIWVCLEFEVGSREERNFQHIYLFYCLALWWNNKKWIRTEKQENVIFYLIFPLLYLQLQGPRVTFIVGGAIELIYK